MHSKLSRRIVARTIAEKLLAEPAKRAHWLHVLAAYMVDHKLADDAELMAKDIAREIFAQSGQLLVATTTAQPLTESLRKDLIKILRETTKAANVVLDEQVDPALLGGFVAQTADAELDASVRTTLQRLAAIK